MALPEYVTINGTNYATDKLSPAALGQLANVQVADAEIARLQQKLALVQTARNTYASALMEAMKAPKAPAADPAAEKPKKPRAPRKPASPKA